MLDFGLVFNYRVEFMKGHGPFLDIWSFTCASTTHVIVHNGLIPMF